MVRAADLTVRAALRRVVARAAPAREYGAALMAWLQARRAARMRLLTLADGGLDDALASTFPASDPLPGPTALTPEGVVAPLPVPAIEDPASSGQNQLALSAAP
jgi:hypothetical protein